LRKIAVENNITTVHSNRSVTISPVAKELPPEVIARLEIIAKLRKQTDSLSIILADLIDFHRREEKPMWWLMFDRAEATSEELRDDPGCIEGIQTIGSTATEKQ